MNYTEESNNSIKAMITLVKDKCLEWIGTDENDNCVVIDPIEHKPIGAHYAMTHIAAALIILGIKENNETDLCIGLQLLEGILNRLKDDKELPAYHYDFNNFALCNVHEALSYANKNYYHDVLRKIENAIIETDDSNHNTINWLPMRMFANKKRFEWSGNKHYLSRIEEQYRIIMKATNKDGFIEDRLPKGKSFNLQYDVATVAGLEFMNRRGSNYDISLNVTALLDVLDREGDINYLGRGCNQVFAWGLWIYLLKMQNATEALNLSLSFLSGRLPAMLANNNILLNEFEGKEHYLWWDYHYCSVYTAHLLLWFALTLFDKPNPSTHITTENPVSDSGIEIIRNDNFFMVLFSGRKEYLSEKGAVIANLWTQSDGTICKGTFGPWQGAFGNKYSESTSVIRNYLGPICTSRFLNGERFKIVFPQVIVRTTQERIIINFNFKWARNATFNLPLLSRKCKVSDVVKVFGDDIEFSLIHIGNIKNQYGYISLFQSKAAKAKCWRMEIRI